MPFLSTLDKREVSQNLSQASFVEEASFSETFAAGVGQVFDEELSISSMLNMQGFNQRKEQVKEHGDSGAFNIDEYTSPVGDVNYKKIGEDFPEFNLKSDQTLFDERAQLLKQRREYANDVFERGNGMAQFLGMATAYMLDPINIATMPIATAGTSVKGLSTLGRAITVGRNEAGLAIAAELMIQPLVYQHKHDINSPFEFKDALLNIVTAATGAAAIGGFTGGISGYIKNVRQKTKGLPLDDDAVMSLEALSRVEDDLNLNPEKINLDLERVEKDFIQEIKAELTANASAKISKAERTALNKQLSTLETSAKKLDGEDLITVKANIDEIKIKLANDELSVKAKSDLVQLEKGKLTELHQRRLNEIKTEAEVDVDSRFLTETNNKMKAVNQPSKVKENYIQPERKKATTGSVSQRERSVVERNGLTKEYDADIEAFKALENPRIVQDDQVVDAGAFMKSIDDEMKGIEEVLTCAI
jgi:hypothetical protein